VRSITNRKKGPPRKSRKTGQKEQEEKLPEFVRPFFGEKWGREGRLSPKGPWCGEKGGGGKGKIRVFLPFVKARDTQEPFCKPIQTAFA